MTKSKNPAFRKELPGLWVLLGDTQRRGLSYDETYSQAFAQGFSGSDIQQYRYELNNLRHNPSDRMRRKAAERLPKRANIRALPFYLRGIMIKYRRTDSDEASELNTYIPDRPYTSLATPAKPFRPITADIATLHAKRHQIVRERAEGLIRWTDTIDRDASTYTICKTFDDFSFKVTANTSGNTLPVVKRHNGISVAITAPREFFDAEFWGLGEHLVVRVLDAYTLADGTSVLKTESCDRMDLYNLREPNVRHIRYYVRYEDRRATGLSETAALKSMGYFMGKEIAHQMGV